jgi:catechol 2,3-dioxygenase-like lactoylglutathione lyase family enzyme
MFDHVSLRVADLAASRAFYDAALAPLGARVLWEVHAAESEGGLAYVGYGRDRPVFWLAQGDPRTGPMHVAFAAESRAQVDAFHRAALAAGGHDNGAPGLRPHYHPNYYGGFAFDPDGVNVEAVCHAPA